MSLVQSRLWQMKLPVYFCACFASGNKDVHRNFSTVKHKVLKDENYVAKHIYQKIKSRGPITIAEYMKDVLTSPSQGYYMSKDMFGEKGDFITSPEISQMFGEMVAVWFLNEWYKIGSPIPLQIVELGPGRGTLSSDILKIFRHFKALHKTSLHLVEISPVLSEIQAKNLCRQSHISNSKNASYREGTSQEGIPVKWYKSLSDVPHGFTMLIAHEFFDALPIHKFHKTYAGFREVLVDIDKKKTDLSFRYTLAKQDTPMSKVLLKPGEMREHVEISPDAQLIYKEICDRITSSGGLALICDYGHDGTGTDTFRAFRQHQQVDPLVNPGTADLTADVDFSAIRQVAMERDDVICLGPATQRDFLLNIGINHRYKTLTDKTKNKLEQENLKKCYDFLIKPDKMGERFKFMCLVPATLRKILDVYPVVGF